MRRLLPRKPCPADWDAMTPTARGRFCGHCRKEVVDLSRLTQTDAEDLVRREGGLCGRVNVDRDGRPMFAAAAAAVVAASLGLSRASAEPTTHAATAPLDTGYDTGDSGDTGLLDPVLPEVAEAVPTVTHHEVRPSPSLRERLDRIADEGWPTLAEGARETVRHVVDEAVPDGIFGQVVAPAVGKIVPAEMGEVALPEEAEVLMGDIAVEPPPPPPTVALEAMGYVEMDEDEVPAEAPTDDEAAQQELLELLSLTGYVVDDEDVD